MKKELYCPTIDYRRHPAEEKPQANKTIQNELTIEEIMKESHRIAVEHGWWETDSGDAVAIANMHSELSEAWEGVRKGNPPSNHIPEFSSVEEEFADVIIRIADTCEARGWNLERAIRAKMLFNESRPFKHGGKKF